MGWANHYIALLQAGETIRFRPRGHSMTGKVNDGDLVVVSPISQEPKKGDVVLCKVNGRQFLHLITAIRPGGTYQISNNHGHVNGWTNLANIYGLVVAVNSETP